MTHRLLRPARSRLPGAAAGLAASLWLGLAAITTVIATTWQAVGTVPHAPHHSGAQRAIS